jgi:hypothetical protein
MMGKNGIPVSAVQTSTSSFVHLPSDPYGSDGFAFRPPIQGICFHVGIPGKLSILQEFHEDERRIGIRSQTSAMTLGFAVY